MMDESSGSSNFNRNGDKSHSNSSSDPYSSEIPDVERYVETVVLSVIALVAGVANVSLWIVVLRSKYLRRQSSMLLLLCLSLADVLVSTISMPSTAITVALSRWVFGEEMCTVMGFINMLTLVCSVMSLGLISINRYIKICHPLRYAELYTLRRIFFMTVGVWCLSAALSSPPLLGWSRYDYLSGQSFCFCDWYTSVSYTFFMVIVCFGGPLSMMTVCNVRILQTFRRSKRVLRSHGMTTSSTNVIVRKERVSIRGEQSIAEEEKENRNIDRSLQKVPSVTSSPEPVPTMPQEDSAADAASDDEMTCLGLKAVNLASGSNDVPQVNTPAPSNTKQAINLHNVDCSVQKVPSVTASLEPVPTVEDATSETTSDDEMMTVSVVPILQTFLRSERIVQSYNISMSSTNVIVRKERVSILGEQPIAEEEKENRNIDRSIQKVPSVTVSPEPVPTMPQEDSVAEAASDDEMTCLDLKAVNVASGSNDIPQVNTPAPSNTKQAINLHSVSKKVVCIRPDYLSKTQKQQRKEKERAEEFQLALSLMVIVAVFVICWLPFCITMFISVYAPHSLPRPANMFTLLLGYSNSCVNPFVYGVRNRQVKNGYKDLWRTLTTCYRACRGEVRSSSLSHRPGEFFDTTTYGTTITTHV